MEKIPNKIIQCFLGETDTIREHTLFCINKIKWQQYSEKYGFQYIFLSKDNIDEYLGEHREFYYKLRYNWSRIDFIRYLVLNKIGGFYIDLDIEPEFDMDLFDLLGKDIVLNKWMNEKTGKNTTNNALIGCRPGQLTSLINYSISEYKKKESMTIYKKWKVRFMMQTTGTRMFERWCKKNKYIWFIYADMYWKDHCTATWLTKFN